MISIRCLTINTCLEFRTTADMEVILITKLILIRLLLTMGGKIRRVIFFRPSRGTTILILLVATEGIGEISTNNSTTNTQQQSGNIHDAGYNDAYFEERLNQLLRFKEEFGHCNVPQRKYSENPSLGTWCNNIRSKYSKKMKNGVYTSSRALSQDRIARLEDIGFQWVCEYDGGFENRCRQLIAFKKEFGHCNVPVKYVGSRNLGHWCSGMRSTYSKIQKGLPTKSPFPAERIARLNEIGFHWKCSKNAVSFEKRCRELVDFKKEFGHGNVPNKYPANPAFGIWCKAMRASYNNAQKGERPSYNISKDRIERLEKLGFGWQGAFE